jgi:hypothetical protein
MGWVVNATSQLLYPQERDPVPILPHVRVGVGNNLLEFGGNETSPGETTFHMPYKFSKDFFLM